MPQKRIIVKPEEFPIQPEHINASEHLFNAFDNSETEISAGWIIRFLQERGKSWHPFNCDEINAFYQRKYKGCFTFNRLVTEKWIVETEEGNYHITDNFVTRCFQSRPLTSATAAK